VGNGREYLVIWTDGSQTTVASNSMFGAFTVHHRLDVGDHVLAADGDQFSAATVVSGTNSRGKLKVKFTDGSTRCVSCSLYVVLVAWFRGITSVFGRCAFAVLRLTCS